MFDHKRICGDNTAHDRMEAINSEILEHYFTLLNKTLEEHPMSRPNILLAKMQKLPPYMFWHGPLVFIIDEVN